MNADLSLKIQGMSCASCVARVERALKKVSGVSEASVNLATEEAHVTVDPTQVSVSKLITAIDDAGYATETAKATFAISGMSCASCVGRVERAIQRLPGVVEGIVNLATEKASVVYLPKMLQPARVVDAITAAGYTASEDISQTAPDRKSTRLNSSHGYISYAV